VCDQDMQDDFEELLEVNDEVQELMGRSYGYARWVWSRGRLGDCLTDWPDVLFVVVYTHTHTPA